MTNQEIKASLEEALSELSELCHKCVEDRLKLGVPEHEVKNGHDHINALFGLLTKYIREIKD
jgi:hypothetical protein